MLIWLLVRYHTAAILSVSERMNVPQASTGRDVNPTLRAFLLSYPQAFFDAFVAESMQTFFHDTCVLDVA